MCKAIRFDPESTPDARWRDDRLAFLRLLGEFAQSCEFTPEQYSTLRDETALSNRRIDEILERASRAWDYYKRTIPRPNGSLPLDAVQGETEECDECGARIPPDGTSYYNRHHQESCSLYDPEGD